MPKSIVLFVCKYDPFGLGFPVYTFSNLCHEKTTLELEAARQMKADGISVEKIMIYIGLSKEEVEEA